MDDKTKPDYTDRDTDVRLCLVVQSLTSTREEKHEAMTSMIAKHTPLARHQAGVYARRGHVEFDDLLQAALIGLMDAVNKFNPSRGTTFATAARWWIRRSLADEIRDSRSTIHVPHHVSCVASRQLSTGVVDDKFSEEHRRDYIEPAMNALRCRGVGGLLYQHESVELPGRVDISESITQVDRYFTQTLDIREQVVLSHRFGLGEYQVLLLREVGDIFHVSKERARQIEKRSLDKLKKTIQVADSTPNHITQV